MAARNSLQGVGAPAPNDWIEHFGTAARSDDIKHMPFYEIPHYTALRTLIPNSESSLYIDYSYRRDEYPPYPDRAQTQVDLGTFPISITSEIEYFDMRADPAQMRPAATPPDATYATRHAAHGQCSGASDCARLEDARTVSDYDGDGKSDLAVWRPADGTWHIRIRPAGRSGSPSWASPAMSRSPATTMAMASATWPYGDLPAASWSIRQSSSSRRGVAAAMGRSPAICRWQATTTAIGSATWRSWRPADGTWHIQHVRDSRDHAGRRHWARLGDRPAPGDYDGDGMSDLAVWRPADGTWHVRTSSDRPDAEMQWGTARDLPIPGDYDGDGITDLAVWRPADGTWHIRKSSDPGARWSRSGARPATCRWRAIMTATV